jgi:hypothetical protein
MEAPEIHVLNRVDWQFFGTCTFRSVRTSDRRRHGMWFALLRRTGRHFGRNFGQLLWALRQEEGELSGRTHFHYLLAGLDRRAMNPTTCFWLMDGWERLGGGMSRVKVFDPRLNAGAYILKDGCGHADASLGGGVYETAKFSSRDCQLTIAKSVWNLARRQANRR